jgi:hypothetical protein
MKTLCCAYCSFLAGNRSDSMKRFLLATAAVAALTASVPASAQVGDILRQGIESILGGNRGATTEPQLRELNNRIQVAYQRGEISQSEASRLQDELRDIAEREQNYRNGGISRAERDDLQQRLRMIEGRIQQASYDGNRDGLYEDRDRRYDDRDGRYDDRYDRDGRWSGNNGRDCPPGLARKNNGCLPPGQARRQGDRYSSEYARVPARYSDRYRDNDHYFYRYNDGRVYQIDRRTNRVVNVTTARR